MRWAWVGGVAPVLLVVAAAAASPVWQMGGAAAGQGPLREFTLVAEPVKWEIQPGLVVDGWGYNGQTPGPTIRVTEGDRVRVHLVNRLPVPTTIHWHGIDVPVAMDGTPGLSQEPVEPGETFTYEFVATNPGTRWYHSHVDSSVQIQLGLYGAFIVDPRPPEPVQYDREFTYLLTEVALDFTPQVALGQAEVRNRAAGNGRGGALQYDLFVMNGKSADAIPPLSIAAGERIRIRLINAGNLVHAMHLHGHSFKIIATDGNPVPPAAQLIKDVVLIGPGERYDLEVVGTNPGVWMFHCHVNNHAANGMVTVLQYDGSAPLAGGDHGPAHGPAAPAPPPPPAPTATPAAAAAPSPAIGAGAGEQALIVDDRFMPSRFAVKAGTTVTWVNRGNNAHTVTSFSGLWDSGTLLHDDTFSYTFTAPGSYRFICRQHFLQGMGGTVTVEPP
jgi:FtsP/CotA-like multicopper oxidase with cupredoxin domain/plastocyanin